jgi:hypothetical protein
MQLFQPFASLILQRINEDGDAWVGGVILALAYIA